VNSKDALGHDKWLDISFRLLGSTAITCGAYTTALLFLELAAEYNILAPSEDPHAEAILFDIYSHIDEPDGFYGIKTQDLRHFLVKRFHHEKQWDKAFRFHGAAVEAGSNVPSEVEGVLQSLHAFGFHNLAINALQNAPSATQATFHSSEMVYHLGWRTETWDLPSNGEERNSGAPLYHALRAIYRERDGQSVDNVVRMCSFGQMEQLRALGDENLFEIRQITQNLMCLNQVRQWRTKKNQQDLAIKQATFGSWARAGIESSDFE
jgi:ataxia telangiectasia mutated family protein